MRRLIPIFILFLASPAIAQGDGATRLEFAKQLLLNGKREGAKVRFDQLIREVPGTKVAAEAQEILDGLEEEEDRKDEVQAEAIYRLAVSRRSAGREHDASVLFGQVVRDFPRTKSAGRAANALGVPKPVVVARPRNHLSTESPRASTLGLAYDAPVVLNRGSARSTPLDSSLSQADSDFGNPGGIRPWSPGFNGYPTWDGLLFGPAKTVYVRAYVRKDGTPVKAHWRSPPGSGPGRRR